MAAVVQVHQDISKAANRLKRHTDSWKKYNDIWKADRISLLDKFKAKAPPTPAFEEKFAKFQKVRCHITHSTHTHASHAAASHAGQWQTLEPWKADN
jgi:hypothetical protein